MEYTPARLRVVSDFMYYLFRLDDISDGMVRSGTRGLADAVMNALWFPDRYMPTASVLAAREQGEAEGSIEGQPAEEISAARLARE